MIVMPSRNTVKNYDTDSYYHVYNRGAGGQKLFIDNYDKRKFLSLLARYVTPKEDRDDTETNYPEYRLEINAYCLMNSHYHLLVYQIEDRNALSGLMRSVSTAYSMYYNKKYKLHGHVTQSIFKASKINNDSYLMHITRYIHMNPRTFKTYAWSSIGAYLGFDHEEWLKPERTITMSVEEYEKFLDEYKGRKAELDELKQLLAD
jgi:putative transposase